jgi:hypothetical protein
LVDIETFADFIIVAAEPHDARSPATARREVALLNPNVAGPRLQREAV